MTRVTGCITNSMIDDLLTKVISVEDIPVDVARELVVLFNVVVKRAPQIFPVGDGREMSRKLHIRLNIENEL